MDIISLLYPNQCAYCGKLINSNTLECSECHRSIQPIRGIICECCGAELMVCKCAPYRSGYSFERNVSPFYYTGVQALAVKRFKLRNRPQLAPFMAKLMYESVIEYLGNIKFDYIAYVPITKKKEIKRKYNQSLLLAENISKMMGVQIKYNALMRVGGKEQKYRNFSSRFHNVKKAFAIKHVEGLLDKTILLVDDVMTSGATLSQCAKLLKEAGAHKVYTATFTIAFKK